MEPVDDTDTIALGGRLKAFRRQRGLTIDALADASGVSRAMISRVERGEASPTAALLGKLCATLGVSMSGFFATGPESAAPLLRAADQPTWRDPGTGYVRRNVSPRVPGSGLEVVDVTFPAGETVRFDNPWSSRPTEQVVWVLEGVLDLTVGRETTRLAAGDSVHMRLDQPIAYHNPGDRPVRYAVVLSSHP